MTANDNRLRRNLTVIGGFTLLELLVVLAIMSLILAAMPAVFSAVLSGTTVSSIAHAMADDLRRARNEAVMRGHVVTWRLQTEAGQYRVPADGPNRSIPEDVIVQFQTPDGSTTTDQLPVRFFSDGSSTGANISLSHNNLQFSVVVDWLNGRVRIYDK